MADLPTTEILGTFPALAGVPENQLRWLADNGLHQHLDAGKLLSSPEMPVTGTHFLMTGSCLVYNYQLGAKRELGTQRSGEITGYLPFSRGHRTTVYISAIEPTAVLTLPMDMIRVVIAEHYELTQALVHVMCNRIRYMTSLQLQNEKMMALGKLSAGITHEINNPAAASISDASSLIAYLDTLPRSLEKLPLTHRDEQTKSLSGSIRSFQNDAKTDLVLSFRERMQLEDNLNEWLKGHGAEDADEIAEALADLGISVRPLNLLAEIYKGQELLNVLTWITDLLRAQRTAGNLLASSKRIEQLVRSVKTFTHMDRGSARQLINIHTGIRNALIMLEHKRKHLNIHLVEDYDITLPEVTALVGELNQVWTNLIDNALDSMEGCGGGTLTIRTGRERDFVQVTVNDNGPGIPEEIHSLIFDPFFTTKEMGKGTGIGLEVVKMIITQHSGTIRLRSVPGDTSFVICLPL